MGTHTYLFVNGVTAPATDGLVGQTNTNSSAQTTAIKNNATYGPLLDDAGDGLVVTSINGRSETRTYAKGVKAGASDQSLSPEEEQVIGYALRGGPR